MAMNRATGTHGLPCGRDVESVWATLDQPGPHEQHCEHCLAAAAALRTLREATGELVAEPLEPSPGLTDRILSAVRAEARKRDVVPLPTPEPGEARISTQAAAAVLRFAADGVAGVRARHCRIVPVPEEGADAVRVELHLAIGYHAFTAGAVDIVRERVAAAASARIGLRLIRLDVTVADVYDA